LELARALRGLFFAFNFPHRSKPPPEANSVHFGAPHSAPAVCPYNPMVIHSTIGHQPP